MKKITFLTMIAMLLGFSSCISSNVDKTQLSANEWQLKEMITTSGKVKLPERVLTLVLTDSTRVYGFAGCNRFFGKYSTEGNSIKFEEMRSTRMTCPDIEIENQFMKALGAATTYSVENKELKLMDKDRKVTLVFVPKVTEEVITAGGGITTVVFQGGDGKSKRLYQANVTFDSTRELAIVSLDGETYELPQQIVTSGYLYKNDKVTLTGKGQETELILPDGKVLKLREKK